MKELNQVKLRLILLKFKVDPQGIPTKERSRIGNGPHGNKTSAIKIWRRPMAVRNTCRTIERGVLLKLLEESTSLIVS